MPLGSQRPTNWYQKCQRLCGLGLRSSCRSTIIWWAATLTPATASHQLPATPIRMLPSIGSIFSQWRLQSTPWLKMRSERIDWSIPISIKEKVVKKNKWINKVWNKIKMRQHHPPSTSLNHSHFHMRMPILIMHSPSKIALLIIMSNQA